ncbi:MAG: hypothetical protein AB2A00_08945 [Myxococcota bacterium]
MSVRAAVLTICLLTPPSAWATADVTDAPPPSETAPTMPELQPAPAPTPEKPDDATPTNEAAPARPSPPSPTTPPDPRWWRAPRWLRLWASLASVAAPTAVVVGVAGAAVLGTWGLVAALLGPGLVDAGSRGDSQAAWQGLYPVLPFVTLAAFVTAVIGAMAVIGYLGVHLVGPMLAPFPDEDGLAVPRLRRGVVFLLLDAIIHVAAFAVSAVGGVVGGGALGGLLAFLITLTPYTVCLPFLLPVGILFSVPPEYGWPNPAAIYALTAIPAYMVLCGGGVLGGALVAAQFGTPVVTLLLLERTWSLPPTFPPPSEETTDDLEP